MCYLIIHEPLEALINFLLRSKCLIAIFHFCLVCGVRVPEFAVHELLLPDAGMVHGRFIVSAWEFGLEGIQDDAVKLLSLAVEVGTVVLAVGHFLLTRPVMYRYFLLCFVFFH